MRTSSKDTLKKLSMSRAFVLVALLATIGGGSYALWGWFLTPDSSELNDALQFTEEESEGPGKSRGADEQITRSNGTTSEGTEVRELTKNTGSSTADTKSGIRELFEELAIAVDIGADDVTADRRERISKHGVEMWGEHAFQVYLDVSQGKIPITRRVAVLRELATYVLVWDKQSLCDELLKALDRAWPGKAEWSDQQASHYEKSVSSQAITTWEMHALRDHDRDLVTLLNSVIASNEAGSAAHAVITPPALIQYVLGVRVRRGKSEKTPYCEPWLSAVVASAASRGSLAQMERFTSYISASPSVFSTRLEKQLASHAMIEAVPSADLFGLLNSSESIEEVRAILTKQFRNDPESINRDIDFIIALLRERYSDLQVMFHVGTALHLSVSTPVEQTFKESSDQQRWFETMQRLWRKTLARLLASDPESIEACIWTKTLYSIAVGWCNSGSASNVDYPSLHGESANSYLGQMRKYYLCDSPALPGGLSSSMVVLLPELGGSLQETCEALCEVWDSAPSDEMLQDSVRGGILVNARYVNNRLHAYHAKATEQFATVAVDAYLDWAERVFGDFYSRVSSEATRGLVNTHYTAYHTMQTLRQMGFPVVNDSVLQGIRVVATYTPKDESETFSRAEFTGLRAEITTLLRAGSYLDSDE